MKVPILISIFTLLISTGFAQDKILKLNVASNESFKTYAAIPIYPVYSEATLWGRCMNREIRSCMSKMWCAAGYSLQPVVYSAAFAMGCAIYTQISVPKPMRIVRF